MGNGLDLLAFYERQQLDFFLLIMYWLNFKSKTHTVVAKIESFLNESSKEYIYEYLSIQSKFLYLLPVTWPHSHKKVKQFRLQNYS